MLSVSRIHPEDESEVALATTSFSIFVLPLSFRVGKGAAVGPRRRERARMDTVACGIFSRWNDNDIAAVDKQLSMRDCGEIIFQHKSMYLSIYVLGR